MTVMVDDLVERSRIHAGTLQLSLQPVGVRDLVSESIADATEIARSQNVTVDGSIDPWARGRGRPWSAVTRRRQPGDERDPPHAG